MMVSLYAFLRDFVLTNPSVRAADPDRAEQVLRFETFDEFVRGYALTGTDMSAMFVDSAGKCIVDFVGRWGTLIARNTSNLGSITSKTQDIVVNVFARDIHAFGYSY